MLEQRIQVATSTETPTATRFPRVRPRRLRRSENIRALVRETEINARDFIYPLFVVHGNDVREEITSMPGVYHQSLDVLAREIEEISELEIPGVILFGLPARKDEVGSEDYDEHGIVQDAIRVCKRINPDLVVATDVCMCQYTSHGHCGIVRNGAIDNDETLKYLRMTSISHAAAGADIVAPSAMMDGQVGAIRAALDAQGFTDTAILAYASKYASSFYGPFREAADSPPQFGDRRQYQMDTANAREALHEASLDIDEGADIVMVKPALAYLDIIRRVRDAFDQPVAAYNVSGEYS
ncbi:MAG: porphobilinogen synthase, partial [Nitrospirae bacterium]|nr:porphobilinogen synthase [Nitrospirota bacterium]